MYKKIFIYIFASSKNYKLNRIKMKFKFLALIVTGLVITFSSCGQKETKETNYTLKSEIDSVSYAIGISIGENFKKQDLTISQDAFFKAMKDVYSNGEFAINKQDGDKLVQNYFQKQQQSKFTGNIEAGKKFLEESAKKEGVTSLPSGLLYEVLTKGTGKEHPGPTSKVTTHYHGTLTDGTVFDSSVDRGQPATFGVNQVIKGWTEILQLMVPGDKWKVYIPYNLAYGERGSGQQIGPYSALVFEIELISISE